MKAALLTTALISLLLPALKASSLPLQSPPSSLDVMERIEPEKLTFLCYCQYSHPLGYIDGEGCSAPGQRVVTGNIVTASMIMSWFPPETLWTKDKIDFIRRVTTDPINTTLFSDATWPAYSRATAVTGTMEPSGQFGTCPLMLDQQKVAHIADGRVAEVARTALYLFQTYTLPMPDSVRKHFIDIAETIPPSDRELERNQMAYEWNGSWNQWVAPPPDSSEYRDMSDKIIEYIYRYRILGE